MVKSGELKAPIVIGRDHLDSGSVASPNRETEAMQDGSDAVSDWPLLNALLNTASGATWVSLHHGGGVGMGYSQHAGVVIVCDGTAEAAEKLERVLWNDPATGVMRHADAGYEIALDCARENRPEPADAGMTMADPQILVPGAADARAAAPPVRPRNRARRSSTRPAAPASAPAPRWCAAPPTATRRSTASTPASASWPTQRIAHDDLATLQLNLLRSHAVGVGEPLAERVVRLILLLKATSLARGYSGVREEVVDALLALHNARRRCRSFPAQGSVGASGDLAPLAHLCLPLIGEGEVFYRRRAHAGRRRRWQRAGLAPLQLSAKEGLALINGTQVSTALALDALLATDRLFEAAVIAGALTLDAARGSDGPFDPRIHAVRGQPGQIDCAAAYRALLAGSAIRRSHLRRRRPRAGPVLPALPAAGDGRLPRPDAPRRAGAGARGQRRDRQPAGVRRRRASAAVRRQLPRRAGGAGRRRAGASRSPRSARSPSAASRCWSTPRCRGLPPFLTPEPGLNSGFMIVHVTAAALASENKSLAHPASVDSLPTSANQEDHVSMATFAARRLQPMLRNTAHIVAIELLAAAQGIEFLRPLQSAPALEGVLRLVRSVSPAMMQRPQPGAATSRRVQHLVASGDIGQASARGIAELAALRLA